MKRSVSNLSKIILDYEETRRITPNSGVRMPSISIIKQIMDTIRESIFPGIWIHYDRKKAEIIIDRNLNYVRKKLTSQIERGLCNYSDYSGIDSKNYKKRANSITIEFLSCLPQIKQELEQDAIAALIGDPAAKNIEEIIFCYPGFKAILYHRIAHKLLSLGSELLPRAINELAHAQTGIDIHPGAKIDDSFFIDHGTGVVIGETCIIGKNVKIYQGVTLGAKSFPKDELGRLIKGAPRHPIIGDNCVIYANATILGRIKIKENSIISGNSWITQGNE